MASICLAKYKNATVLLWEPAESVAS